MSGNLHKEDIFHTVAHRCSIILTPSAQIIINVEFVSGTRFRPLSLDIPKPLFPVAGLPMIQHHVEACVNVPNLKEILILGYYPASELAQFVSDMVQEYKVNIR
jgi:NDP-sugar pyrophosphorylase family protein